MAKLIWLKSARDDLKDIYDFIAADSKKYASYQIKEIREQTYLKPTQRLVKLSRKLVMKISEKLLAVIIASFIE